LAEKVFGKGFTKGEFCELFLQYSVVTSVRVEDGIVKSASKSVIAGTGVRVVDGDTTGYAYTESFKFDKILKACKFAQAVAKSGGSYKPVHPFSVDSGNYYSEEIPISTVDLNSRVKIVKNALDGAKKYSDYIKKVTVNLVDSTDNIFIINSNGEYGEDFQPSITLSVTAVAEKEGNVQFGKSGCGKRQGYEFFNEFNPYEYGKLASKQAVTMLDAKSAPAGVMPVVLGAGESGVLIHESVGHPLEADFIKKGTSAYSGRVGEKVASSLCTVVDDGTVPYNRGSINFDDELSLSKRTVLIENGVLKGFMHDRITARALKSEITGNGRRESFKYNPIPRMRTTYLEGGKYDKNEIVKSVKKGIYCVSFAGGQVDIASGDFVFVPSEAWLIEDGKITCPVKNLTLIGNGPDVLTKVEMIGNDFKISDSSWVCGKGQSVPVGIGMPTLKISAMTVGGSNL
jgi:TldD protein